MSMKKIVSGVLVIFILHLLAASLWAVPFEERKVILPGSKKFGEEDYKFSPPYIKEDEHHNFRYLRAREWNLVQHKFATTPDFRSLEEAARFYLSDKTYGPLLGLLDEASELKLINIKTLYSGSSVYHMGRQFVRFQQYFQDIPVIAAEIIVQLNSKLELINIIGRVVPGMAQKDISITPVVSSEDAIQTALNKLSAKYGINSDQLTVNSAQTGIFNQYIFDGTESICSLVWQVDIDYNGVIETILVDAQLEESVVMLLPLHSEERLFYSGQTGAICDTFEMIKNGIQDTLSDMPQTITDVTYSCNDEKRDGRFVNSGVGNKAAYLMAHGGSIQSGDQTIVFTGIGEKITMDIFKESRNMLPLAADFYDFYYALLQASKNLGLTDLETDHVKKAIDFVQMDAVPCQFDEITGIKDKPQCKFGCGVEILFEDHFDSADSLTNWAEGTDTGTPYWFVPQTISDIGFNQSFANSGEGNAWAFAQKGESDTWLSMTQDVGPLPCDSFLFFAHAYIFDASDTSDNHPNGGIIEYSTNGGISWSDCSLLKFNKNGYNGTISSNSVNPLKGRNAFVGKSNGYIATVIDLTSLENQTVRFRFRMGTGGDLSYYGWFIDDFQIYTCDIFTQIPLICQNPTIRSTGSGDWNNSGLWSTGQMPGIYDIVRVDHTMTVNINNIRVKALCNFAHIKSDDRDIKISGKSFIHNDGNIWAADGTQGYWEGNQFRNGGDGRHVILRASVVQNGTNGNIQAGRGGHALAADFSHALRQVKPKGGNGGNIVINADYIKNKGNMGPGSLSYSTKRFFYTYYKPRDLVNTIMPDSTTDGGNGGICCNGYKDAVFTGNHIHRGYVSNYGNATGGKGGDIILNAKFSIEHSGVIAAGNGAPSRVAGAYGSRIPGDAGIVYFNAKSTTINGKMRFDNFKFEDASRKGGALFWDPEMSFNGEGAQISGAQNIVIFGGDWDVVIGQDTQPGAFSADSIHIALGEKGSLNLLNASTDVFQANEKVVISADINNIPVDGDRSRASIARLLKRTIDAPVIELQSSEIKYEFDVSIESKDPQERKRKEVRSEQGGTSVFDITLINSGPNSDAYSIKLIPSEGITVSEVQQFVRVGPLSTIVFPLEVTIPETICTTYTVDVIVESHASLFNTKVKTIQLSVEPTMASFKFEFAKAEPGLLTFTAETIDDTQNIVSYQWTMGDGSPSKSGATINHTYTQDGTYNVLLTVTNSEGYTEIIQRSVAIKKSKVLLLAADDIKFTPDFLVSTNLFQTEQIEVKANPTRLTTTDLLPYNAVLVWSKFPFTAPDNVGNVLKEYVDNGGGIVLASYCFFEGELQIDGNILNDGYSPFLPSGLSSVGQFIRISDQTDPEHFLFSGIQEIDIDGRNPAYRIDESKGSDPDLKTDGILLATDSQGRNVVASNELGNVVAVNMYPEQLVTPGAKRLLANALLYVSGEAGDLRLSSKEVHVRATSGTVEIDVTNTGNGSMYWEASTNAFWIHIESGSKGTDDGTIKFSYDPYNDPEDFRVGEILVSALGALNSPMKILVYQGENDAPSISSIPDQTVLEDHEINVAFTVSDNETRASDLLVSAYANNTTLIPDSAISFNNPGTDRILTIKPAENQFGTATITVTVSDQSHVVTRDFNIIVNAVNDKPYFYKGDNIVLKRNQHYDLLQYPHWPAEAQTGPSNENAQQLSFHVLIDNTFIQYFDQIPSVSDDGTLIFDPKDTFDDNKLTIGVYVTDDGGVADGGMNQSEAQYFTIYYADDIPSFTKGASVFVDEDCGAQIISEWATNIDSGTDDISPNLSFIIRYISSGPLFSEHPAIDSNGNLRFTPNLNRNGLAIITVYLQDNDRNVKSEKARFLIVVSPVNDSPSFSGQNVESVEDDLPQSFENWVTDIYKGPEDEQNQSIRFEVTHNSNPSLFSKQPYVAPDGLLTYTSAPDQNGIAQISVLIRDNGTENSEGCTKTYQIVVHPKNDQPSFTSGNTIFEYDEDIGCRTIESWASTISKGPADEKDQQISFTVITDNDQLFENTPSITPLGDLTICFKPDQWGIANLYVTIEDNGGTEYGVNNIGNTEKIAIRVNNINDCPEFNKGGDQSRGSNDGEISVSEWATDISPGINEIHQSVYFEVQTDNDTLFKNLPAIDPIGKLTYEIQPGISGEAEVSVVIKDNGNVNGNYCNESIAQSFTIRSTETSQMHNITITAMGNGAIQWDNTPQTLPVHTSVNDGSEMTLQAIPDSGWTFDGWDGVTDQQNPVALTIHSATTIIARFIQNSEDTVVLSLSEGWNLFSCPLQPVSDSVQDIFPDDYVNCYYYDSADGAYKQANRIEPGLGYWIKLSESANFEISGSPGQINPQMTPGWHLLGSAYDLVNQNIISEDTHVFVFQNQAYQDVLIKNVSKDNGFWIKFE